MEIEVGGYIRTRYGHIEKVKFISKYDDGDIHINTMRGLIYFRPREITKHSKNIIDLIEVGDYINGEYVSKVTKNYINIGRITYGKRELKGISSIVTKEQFQSIEYKVGD